MPINPPTQDSIFTDIRDRVLNSDADITNWSPQSPEKALTDEGFASLLYVLWHATLASQLAGWIDYAGGPITEDDLDDLGLESVDAGGSVDLDLLNDLTRDEDLDAKVAQNSITRDPGAFATGEVEITTNSDSVVVDSGFRVTTDSDDPLAFETTEEVTPSAGSTTVTADIEAVERGSEFNVGSDTITQMPSPPQGVSGVTNPSATTGGEDEETNAELRERGKRAIVNNSGGGTVGGIEGAIASEYDGVDINDVKVEEFPNADPPHGEVIVDGGPDDGTLQDFINEVKPSTIAHPLIRPDKITVDVDADVAGTDVDTAALEAAVTDYLQGLGLGDDVIRDAVVATLMTEDADVEGIDSLTITDSGGEITDDRTIADREKAIAGSVSVVV